MPQGQEDSPSATGKRHTAAFGITERPESTAVAESVATNSVDPLIGRILRETYRIVGSLEEGGMGKLYRAEHLRLRRPVAVKFMARTLVTNTEAMARFRREAEIISQLEHPHIVHILDFDATPEGEPYIVMELLSGMTLSERVADSPQVPLHEALEIALQISSGLMLAHASGIVHRDLKPDNVFLLSMTDRRVFVKLLDFGISMGNAAATRLTGKYDVLGTPDYMAPEQALDSSGTDHRADQWSLACLVYEMLAGRPPFTGASVVELLRNVVHEKPPPLLTFAPDIPAELEQVLLRALSKDPNQRYSCIAELAECLAAAARVQVAGDSQATACSGAKSTPRRSKPTRVEGKSGRPKSDSATRKGVSARPDNGCVTPASRLSANPSKAPKATPRRGNQNGETSDPAKAPNTERPVQSNLRSTQPERGRIRRYSNSKLEAGTRASPDRGPNSPHEPERASPQQAGIQALFDQLSRAIAFADDSESLELARSVIKQAQMSDSVEARRAVAAAADQLTTILLRSLGRPDCMLHLNSAAPTAKDATMTPQHMFLFSRIVNRMTIDELLDLTPLSKLDTLNMVLDFRDRGYLTVE